MDEELDEFFLMNFVNNIQEAENDVEDDERYLRFLPKYDPFTNMSETKFLKCFRFTKIVCREVVTMLTPYMQEAKRKSDLRIETKVLVALRFFASGSYQEITGSNIYLAISQSSVSRAIHETCDALTSPDVFHRFIKFPQNLVELRQLRQRFSQKYDFPGIVGIIDCTHVSIIAPQGDPEHPEQIYVNRKGYHSLNVQLICDEQLKVINTNARYPGSTHDSFIWRQSNISGIMENIYRHNPNESFFLLGDSGYPLRPWLLTPIRNIEADSPEERFNNRFTSIRSSIERCNGIIKNRFRCLLKHRTLHYKPQTAAKIILACTVLHNICINNNIPAPEDDVDQEEFGMDLPPDNLQEHGGNDLNNGRRLRNRIVNAYFNQ